MPSPPGVHIVSPGLFKCAVLPTVGLLLLVLPLGACSRAIDGARSLPPRLTVLVQEDQWFYYWSETGDREGCNPELIDRLQRHVAVPGEIKS